MMVDPLGLGAVDFMVPDCAGAYIYFLMNNGKVVYVGKSKQFLVRIGAHYHGSVKKIPKKAFDAVRYIEVDPKQLDEYEAFFIILYRPEYNRVFPSTVCWGKTVRKIAKKFGYYIVDSFDQEWSVTFKRDEDIRKAS